MPLHLLFTTCPWRRIVLGGLRTASARPLVLLLGAACALHCAHAEPARGLRGNSAGVDAPPVRPDTRRVFAVADAVELAAAGTYVCARQSAGDVVCWGCEGELCREETRIDLPPGAIGIAAGPAIACARRLGGADCWETGSSPMPLDRATLTDLHRVEDLALGRDHACILVDAAVSCAGDNASAQLGFVGPSSRTPLRVPDLADVAQIVAGDGFSCARRTSGRVVCWGTDERGQLGNGRARWRGRSTAVRGLRDVVELTAGAAHICARKRDGSVVCWGDNRRGQLTAAASGDTATRPVVVFGITDAVQLSASAEHTCALLASGLAACWGDGGNGQLGVPPLASPPARPVPIVVDGAVEIAATHHRTCARLASGAVTCWGDTSGYMAGPLSPHEVEVDAHDFVELAAGKRHMCARRTSGNVVCWGDDNSVGQLGDGSFQPNAGIVTVKDLTDVVAIDADDHLTCACRRDGAVLCWGATRGLQGTGEPILIPAPADAVDVDVASTHLCLLRANGEVWCWARFRPEPMPGIDQVTQLSAGHDRTCGRRSDGSVLCWPWKEKAATSDPPVVFPGVLTDVSEVGVGQGFACARFTRGTIACWGDMPPRAAHSDARSVPMTLPGIVDAVELSVAPHHACARTGSGQVRCWGQNRSAQLGDGTTIDRVDPVLMRGIDDAVEVATSEFTTCVRRASGAITCWSSGPR